MKVFAPAVGIVAFFSIYSAFFENTENLQKAEQALDRARVAAEVRRCVQDEMARELDESRRERPELSTPGELAARCEPIVRRTLVLHPGASAL
jgi:hypothetical protein